MHNVLYKILLYQQILAIHYKDHILCEFMLAYIFVIVMIWYLWLNINI